MSKSYEFDNLPPPKYEKGTYVRSKVGECGRIDFVNGVSYLHTDPEFRYGVKFAPFGPDCIPSHVMLKEDEIFRVLTDEEVYRLSNLKFSSMMKYRDAVLNHYKTPDIYRENIDEEMYKTAGLPSRDTESFKNIFGINYEQLDERRS